MNMTFLFYGVCSAVVKPGLYIMRRRVALVHPVGTSGCPSQNPQILFKFIKHLSDLKVLYSKCLTFTRPYTRPSIH